MSWMDEALEDLEGTAKKPKSKKAKPQSFSVAVDFPKSFAITTAPVAVANDWNSPVDFEPDPELYAPPTEDYYKADEYRRMLYRQQMEDLERRRKELEAREAALQEREVTQKQSDEVKTSFGEDKRVIEL